MPYCRKEQLDILQLPPDSFNYHTPINALVLLLSKGFDMAQRPVYTAFNPLVLRPSLLIYRV